MANLSSAHRESSEHEPILPNAEQITGVDGEDTTEGDSDVHIASHAEKKSLWWRSALTNAFFILTWYDAPAILYLLEPLSTSIQVSFCDGSLRV